VPPTIVVNRCDRMDRLGRDQGVRTTQHAREGAYQEPGEPGFRATRLEPRVK
jgi:hypothetical protein